MRVKGLNLQQALLGAALIGALCWNLAHASEIKGLRVDTGATGTRAELLLDREGQYKLIDLHNPDRLVVDFPDSKISRGLAMPQAAGVVKGVRSGQPQPGTVRIVFDLAGNVSPLKPRIEQSAEGPRLVLEWPGDGVADAPVTAPAATIRPATSHLDPIAEIARKAADTPVTAAVAADAAATDKVAASSTLPTATAMPGVVATGIPTRIATGQPADDAVAAQPIHSEPAPLVRRTLQAGMRPLVVAIDNDVWPAR